MAEFQGTGKIYALLSNGLKEEISTLLKCEGEYKEWTEDMHPDGIGYYQTFCESWQDPESIQVLYPDEFELAQEPEHPEKYEGVTITKILNIIEDPDWEVQDGWEADYEPDLDDEERLCA